MRPTSMRTTVDFDAQGVQHGYLQLPHSRDDSAWGSVMLPVTVIRNGDGPTALITGGNHGDEYEGPLAILDLAAQTKEAQVSGRIILIPFMNGPAVLAGRRTSPVDGGNMNRAFPGRPDGTVTDKIADYFTRTLLPMADLVLDFHSGGRTLDFLPFAASHVLDDKEQEGRCSAARDAFCAPFTVQMAEIDPASMYDHAAESQGKTFVTTELGGRGTATPETTAIARRGLRNVLIHAGILAGTIEPAPTRHISQENPRCFHFSPAAGMIEFCATIGDEIVTGDVLARIWPLDRTGTAPLDVTARMDGLLTVRHHPGLIAQGDCLAVLSTDLHQKKG
ncbi:N(2)-acetyl-L-2,4-diaminobutanoate deacetylase DoeB [Roseobacter ponti]|uniref:N-alpha-acetyl diaminobutyric acid deacetylase DoeB n=1 Tax=Roseobacter ponti TaxID=1891787 RepID=A0A858SQJ8_9RHOB|nr:N(2)-acetyl-L-2,4-diaminobutanoate deacetylase DoeB [Roseobacter ponti]QJF51024.1 N-alpha-acetyl diaminobutyric acid deacetylase DoeB [Roseobacter ponti]